MIFKLIIIAISIGVLLSYLKIYSPEFFTPTLIITSIFLLLFISDYFFDLINFFDSISEMTGLDSKYVRLIVKILAISYLIEFAVGVVEDMQLKSLSEKLLLCGKVVILVMILPIFNQIVSILLNFL